MGAQGTALLDFGAYPGAIDASLDVGGQAGYVAASLVEAWILPAATADHTVDEHRVEELDVMAFYKADGTFTIAGRNTGSGVRNGNGFKLYGKFNIGWAWN